VSFSGAGPPLAAVELDAEIAVGPPGLWLADRMIAPKAARGATTQLAAGVDRMPARPTRTRPKPFAAAMRTIVRIATSLWKRPSPPTTSVLPAKPVSESKIDWTKFSR
jgi:hypothetical protein